MVQVFDGITKKWTVHEAFKANGFGLRGIVSWKDCVYAVRFLKYNIS